MASSETLMDRRRFLGAIAGAAAAQALARMGFAEEAGGQGGPPNLIIIFTDDQGYGDVGCYGAIDIKTPRLDRMAREGVRFTDFHTASPVCTPARAAILTGCYAKRVGLNLVLYAKHDISLNPDEVTIADVARSRGYLTGGIDKWHLGRTRPAQHGFDSWAHTGNLANRCTERNTEEAIKFIRRNKDRPFLLYLAHIAPHVPLAAFPPFKGRSNRGLYGDVIETLDWSTGEILDELARLGLDGKTLVIFTSDNGPWLDKKEHGGSAGPLRGGKFKAFEGGTRVPCIMRWPGRIPAGKVCSELATTMDILPTFARLCGGKVPADRVIDGKDIWPLMAGEAGAKSPHEAFFHYEGANPTRLRAVRSGRWKLFGWPEAKVARPGWYPTELYDLETDLGETKNVGGKHPDVVKRLVALLERHREDIRKNSRPPARVPAK